MTPLPPPPQDLSTQWSAALRLYPIYFQLAREFVIDVQPCADLETGVTTPGKESVEQANKWLEEMDARIQVHQLRQFLQTSTLANEEGLLNLIQHFLAKPTKTEALRDKLDFLLVQYFNQKVPSQLSDDDVDLAYVAQELEPALGAVELKTPVWLNALDRVLDSARKCKTLDELLHGGILAQGRKAKTQAGDLFYLPVAMVAFTRFGYLMRRNFFHLMHGDLNAILDGLDELEEKNIATIDCRRAQFSAQEPIARLRMICQSWKVMFQAEYSTGTPLRMLVDLRASIAEALGQGTPASATAKPKAAVATPAGTAKPPIKPVAKVVSPAPKTPSAAVPAAKAAAASASASPKAAPKPAAVHSVADSDEFAVSDSDVPEFEISASPDWDPDGQAGSNS